MISWWFLLPNNFSTLENLYQIHRNFQRVCFGVFPGVPFLEAMLVSERVIRQPNNFGFGRKKQSVVLGFNFEPLSSWLIVGLGWWFGFLGSPYERDCYIHRIPNHRAPNQQLTISWTTAAKKKQQPWICDWPWCLEKGSKMMIPWRFGRSCSFLNGWSVGSMLVFQGVGLDGDFHPIWSQSVNKKNTDPSNVKHLFLSTVFLHTLEPGKNSLTFQYTGCWMGILIMVYYNPHITG